MIINNLQATNGNTTVYKFLALEEIGFDCGSVVPGVVDVIVNPLPVISTAEEPIICEGEFIDLSTIQVTDQSNSNGIYAFYTDYPPAPSNVLISPIVSPTSTQDYFIRKISNSGCEDSTRVTVEVLPSPTATISPNQDTLQLCRGTSRFLSGSASGGFGGHSQVWSNFQTASTIFVGSGGVNGAENLMTYTVTDQNQCTDTDSILIRTVSSVDTVQITNISPVSFCFGNDGSITLTPLDGIPNYTYVWAGPVSGSFSTNGGHTIPNLSQGSYSITITDSSSEGCEFILNNVVIEGPSANISVDSIRPVSCFGENDGGIFTTVSGNTPSISWSPNIGSGDDVTGLSAGLYNVTVSDGVCQTIVTDIEIPEPDSLFAISAPEDLSLIHI